MANVIMQSGDLTTLQALRDNDFIFYVLLFQNDHTPDPTDDVSNYTQADFSGYPGPTAATWGDPFINGADKGEMDADPIAYTHSGGGTSNTVYGIYVIDFGGNLFYADRFPAPFLMSVGGDTFSYQPILTCVTE